MRRFHHGGFVVRPDSGIKAPKDLEGKKVGVRAYSVTTGVWTRGIFINEYGLELVEGDLGGRRRGARHDVEAAAERGACAGRQNARRHDGGGRNAGGVLGPAGIGRAGPPTGAWETGGQAKAEVYPELIPDVEKTEADWFRRTGIYPIHGLVVVRDEVLWKHPFVARALYDAFVAAKAPYIAQLKAGVGDDANDKKYRGLIPLVGDPLP